MSSITAGTTSTTTLVHSGDTTGSLVFKTNDTGSGGTTAVTIDTSQNVGIGNTTPSSYNLNAYKLVIGSNSAVTGMTLASGTSAAGNIFFARGTSGADAYDGYVQYSQASQYMAFGTGGGTERMRIDSSGNVGIGTTAPNGSFRASITGNGTATTRVNFGDVLGFVDGSTIYLGSDGVNPTSWVSNAGYRFGSSRQGCVVAINPSGYTYEGGSGGGSRTFAVNSNGNVQNSNNSYGSLSDAKLKENITDATPKLENLMRVKIRNFNLIADEAKTKQIGVVAQELEEIFPSMIDEHIDYTFETYVKEDGSKDSRGVPTGTVTKEVKYSVFVPMLIKAIQELKAINDTQAETINALTARLVALEAK